VKCILNKIATITNFTRLSTYNSIQFISLSIDPLQGVNHMDVENSHKIHQNIQSSTIQLDTVYVR
jgi:hypothetical protein